MMVADCLFCLGKDYLLIEERFAKLLGVNRLRRHVKGHLTAKA